MKPVIAVIPLRGGSKGIPKKNIRAFCGRPLCYWSIRACEQAPEIDKVYIATNSDEIAEVVNGLGFSSKVEVVDRPAETATDTASTESLLNHMVDTYESSKVVLVQATNPFLKADDLSGSIKTLEDNKLTSLVSVVRQHRFFWQEQGTQATPKNYDPNQRPRRQDWQGELVENGAFYISRTEDVISSRCRVSGDIGFYEMSQESYFEIDSEDDWFLAEQLFRRRYKADLDTSKIRLLVTDVDGTLTDGGMYYSDDGEKLKKFNTRDAVGLQRLRDKGLWVAVMTGEDSESVTSRMKKLGIELYYPGIKDKVSKMEELLAKLEIDWSQLAFVGDDLNDVSVMSKAGLTACPSDAAEEVKAVADLVCENKGGDGAVREFAEALLFEREAE